MREIMRLPAGQTLKELNQQLSYLIANGYDTQNITLEGFEIGCPLNEVEIVVYDRDGKIYIQLE